MQNELAQLDKAASLAKLEPLQRISQGLKVIYDHVLRSDQNPLPRYFDQIFSGHEALLGMIDLVAAGQIVRAPDDPDYPIAANYGVRTGILGGH